MPSDLHVKVALVVVVVVFCGFLASLLVRAMLSDCEDVHLRKVLWSIHYAVGTMWIAGICAILPLVYNAPIVPTLVVSAIVATLALGLYFRYQYKKTGRMLPQ